MIAPTEQMIRDLRIYMSEYDSAQEQWQQWIEAERANPFVWATPIGAVVEAGAALMGWLESYLLMVDHKEGEQ